MFRQIDAKKLGDSLLEKHGLLQAGWKIEFNKSPSHLGQCWHQHKAIALSLVMLNSAEESQVYDTILHEIAHALVGPGHNHDEVWKEKAKSIGCTSEVCGRTGFNPVAAIRIEPSQVPEKKKIPPLIQQCPKCGAKLEIKTRARISNKEFLSLHCGHLIKPEDIKGKSFSEWESTSGKKLYPYQIEAAEFLVKSGGRALIADEPGLGKTAEVMAMLKHYPEILLPCLWITKSKLKVQASKEFIDWCGVEYFPCMIDTSKSFILPGFKIYVISMDLLRRMSSEKMEQIGFKSAAFDETQHISNPSAARTVEVRRIAAQVDYFFGLSGTPWKNRATEYFSILNILRPDLFNSQRNFEERWVEWYETSDGKTKAGGIRNVKAFREYTKDFVIRRLRDDVLPDLPKINRQINYVEIEDIFQSAYEKAEKVLAEKIKDQILETGEINVSKFNDDIMVLKHIVGLAKVDSQVEQAIEFIENSEDWEKLTIYHHHIDVGDNLERKLNAYLKSNGYNAALRIRGGMTGFESDDIATRFKDDPKARILIASALAGGEGLNLQFCQNAFMMERQWNAANEEQPEKRFSRPLTWGDYKPYLQEHLFNEDKQPKKVSIRIPYLIAADTADETLTEIVERKRHNYVKSMNEGSEDIKWDENEIMKELLNAIMKKRYGKAA